MEVAAPEGVPYAKDIAEKYGVTYEMLTKEKMYEIEQLPSADKYGQELFLYHICFLRYTYQRVKAEIFVVLDRQSNIVYNR